LGAFLGLCVHGFTQNERQYEGLLIGLNLKMGSVKTAANINGTYGMSTKKWVPTMDTHRNGN
jgi:hypothetical protein